MPQNFREGSATFEQVLSWAYPPRHVLAMLMPNFFGSPAEHSVFNVFTGQTVPMVLNAHGQINPNGIYSTMWGMKNYVEGGAYLGILPLLLAVIAVAGALRSSRVACFVLRKKYVPPFVRPIVSPLIAGFFVFLTLISLAFMFGTLLYAILYYGLPGINQLHSPFRWVWPFTISIAVLAAMGVDRLMQDRERDRAARKMRGPINWFCLNAPVSFRTVLAGGAFWSGAIIFVGLVLSRWVFPTQSLGVAEKLLQVAGAGGYGLSRCGAVLFAFVAQWADLCLAVDDERHCVAGVVVPDLCIKSAACHSEEAQRRRRIRG